MLHKLLYNDKIIMLVTIQACLHINVLVSGVTTDLQLPIDTFKKRKFKDENLCGIINVLMMVVFVRTLDQSCSRRAPSGCYKVTVTW